MQSSFKRSKSPAKSLSNEFQDGGQTFPVDCNRNADFVTDHAQLVRVDSQLSDHSVRLAEH